MDPESVAATAIGAAATTTATKGVDKVHDLYGIKGILTTGAVIIGVLALFQAVKTKSFGGILG